MELMESMDNTASRTSALIDVHSHVLPGFDDGARDLSVSLGLLHRLAEEGVSDLVLTPHFYTRKESVERFVERREASLAKLLAAAEITALPQQEYGLAASFHASENASPIRIYLAGECSLSATLMNYDSLEPLVFGRGRYLLLEMPFEEHWDAHVLQQVEQLIAQFKLIPIIAHIERYPATRYGRSLDVVADLVELGCLIQLNVDSLFSRETRRNCLNLLKGEWIDILGSDSHNLTSRPPRFNDFRSYVKKKLQLDIDGKYHLDLN